MKIKVFVFIVSVILILVSCKSIESNLNIVEGRYVDDGDYPTVMLLNESMNKDDVGCSSTIISNNVILTAAHCVEEEEVFVEIGDKFIKGSSYIYLDEYKKRAEEDENIYDKRWGVIDSYLEKKVTRDSYEKQLNELNKRALMSDSTPYDLGAVIFDDIAGVPPFESIIKDAKKKGVFPQLIKNSFENNTVLKSVSFLGFGGHGSYSKVHYVTNAHIDIEGVDQGKKQIGSNTFTYDKNKNEWYSPKPINRKIGDYLYVGANGAHGDSGGPLIYNNQILGVVSRGYEYDCEGNLIYTEIPSDKFIGWIDEKNKSETEECRKDNCCLKMAYASSRFTSIILGTPMVESFLKKVRNELDKKGLLENNSVFKELLEK